MNAEQRQQIVNAATPEVGEWRIEESDGQVMLSWRAYASFWHDHWYGDEPWVRFGGNELIEALGLGDPRDAGADQYQYKGTEYVEQWARWDVDIDAY